MDKMELEPSPLDGLVIRNKDHKRVLLYNVKLKTFETFYQYTNADIEAAKEEVSYEDEREEGYDSVRVLQ